MAVKTYRLAAGQDGNFAALVDGTDQAAATRTDGWTVARIVATNQSDFDAGTKQASGTFAVSAKPASFLTGATANALKIPAALKGDFAATAWTITFALRATVVSAQAGRIRMRVFKSVNADGSAATEITGATQVGTTSAVLSTTADVTSVVTWSPGAFTLNNEYLFFVLAWEITTVSGSNTADVQFRTGQAAAGTRVVTADLAVPTPVSASDTNTTTTENLSVVYQIPTGDSGVGTDSFSAVSLAVPKSFADSNTSVVETPLTGIVVPVFNSSFELAS